MKDLVIGLHQKASNFLAFFWSPHGSLVSFHWSAFSNQEGSIVIEKDLSKVDLITKSDQAVHSCNRLFSTFFFSLATTDDAKKKKVISLHLVCYQ